MKIETRREIWVDLHHKLIIDKVEGIDSEDLTKKMVAIDDLKEWCKEFKPRSFQISALLDKIKELEDSDEENKQMDDYETIDYKKHYDETKSHSERIEELEKKVKQLMQLVKANELY